MAGTSTGSILSAGLAKPEMTVDPQDASKYVPTGKPRFYATELVDIYKTKGDQIFQKYALSGG